MSDYTQPESSDYTQPESVEAEAVTEEAAPAPFTTVREYRHAAKNALVTARQGLSVRTDSTGDVYRLLNGVIENIIAGKQGLTQEQQVERLYDAAEQAKENRDEVVAAAEAARDEVIAIANAWPETFAAALDSAVETLTEGKTFAEERDFQAHQSKKRRASYAYGGGYRSGRYTGSRW